MSNRKNLQNGILRLGQGSLRLFANPCGTGWQGKIISRTPEYITLQHPRLITFGLCPGSSDVVGFKSVEVSEEMTGTKIAVFTAIEIKTDNDTIKEHQSNFLKIIGNMGGVALIGRDVETVKEHIELWSPNDRRLK
ncbi:MAG: VRR-NUC domain-containing protein [Magnetococcus sp. DMHC-1]